MSFFKASTKTEDIKQGGSNHITSSGVFPVTIIAPIVSVSKNGSTTVDLYLNHQGQKQVTYGNLRITNNDGSPNKIGAKIFNQLLIIAGVEEIADPIEADLPVGKKEAMKPCAVLEDLADIDILMRVQMKYSVFKGNIQEKKEIKGFFRASDNATAEEIVNETDIGKGFEREKKYLNNVTYLDGLTEEAVKAWIQKGRPLGTASGTPTTGTGTDTPPSFGQKRFGQG